MKNTLHIFLRLRLMWKQFFFLSEFAFLSQITSRHTFIFVQIQLYLSSTVKHFVHMIGQYIDRNKSH